MQRGPHPNIPDDLIPYQQRGLARCECGRTYNLFTVLDREPLVGSPGFYCNLESLTACQWQLAALMCENGRNYGRKRATLDPNYWISKDWQPRGKAKTTHERKWVELDGVTADFLRGHTGHGWSIVETVRVVHPPPELVAAFEKRLDGFRDMEHLRSQFVKGRPKDTEAHRLAAAIVGSVRRDYSEFNDDDIAMYVGVSKRTLRRLKK